MLLTHNCCYYCPANQQHDSTHPRINLHVFQFMSSVITALKLSTLLCNALVQGISRVTLLNMVPNVELANRGHPALCPLV